MRWFAYFILAYAALALQIGLGPYVSYREAKPNLVLLAAVFIGMNARREPALIGCLLMGLMQDLLTAQPLGSHAFAYGLVGLFVVGTQQVVYRDHPLTHFALALIAGVITTVVVLIAGWLHPPGPPATVGDHAVGAVRHSLGTELARVRYTAVLAVPVLWALGRIRRAFAFQGSYRKIRR